MACPTAAPTTSPSTPWRSFRISLRRRRQLALLQPTTKTRLDLGLILKDRPPAGRLEASGSFNAMFTHRVKLSGEGDLDAEALAWLKAAYDAAG